MAMGLLMRAGMEEHFKRVQRLWRQEGCECRVDSASASGWGGARVARSGCVPSDSTTCGATTSSLTRPRTDGGLNDCRSAMNRVGARGAGSREADESEGCDRHSGCRGGRTRMHARVHPQRQRAGVCCPSSAGVDQKNAVSKPSTSNPAVNGRTPAARVSTASSGTSF